MFTSNNTLFTALGLLAILGAASASMLRQSSQDSEDAKLMATDTDSDLKMLAFETAINEAILALPKSRARRAAQRHCGKKLMVFILSTCGQPCDPQEAVDISTTCCGAACDVDYIKKTCCPSQ